MLRASGHKKSRNLICPRVSGIEGRRREESCFFVRNSFSNKDGGGRQATDFEREIGKKSWKIGGDNRRKLIYVPKADPTREIGPGDKLPLCYFERGDEKIGTRKRRKMINFCLPHKKMSPRFLPFYK